ncbi:MAG: WYL domain-containing protein [Candidatus Omnitrophica bacterium]|nr:WYL domain-containing protein [Candidatus Omnitrophota bacterium]
MKKQNSRRTVVSPRKKKTVHRVVRLRNLLSRKGAGEAARVDALARLLGMPCASFERACAKLQKSGLSFFVFKKGMYRFSEGAALFDGKLSGEELSLLLYLFGVSQSLGEPFNRSFHSLLKKITGSGEAAQRERTPQPAQRRDAAAVDYSGILRQAIDEQRKVVIAYETFEGRKTYKLLPLKLIIFGGFTVLLSQVDGNDWVLKFRLEKISAVRKLSERFQKPAHMFNGCIPLRPAAAALPD